MTFPGVDPSSREKKVRIISVRTKRGASNRHLGGPSWSNNRKKLGFQKENYRERRVLRRRSKEFPIKKEGNKVKIRIW